MTGQYNNITIFKDKFYQFFGLDQKYQNGETPRAVYMGYMYPIDVTEFVIFFFDWWVELVDQVLDLHQEKNSDDYALKFGQRGFTFDEFKMIMNGRIKAQNFDKERAYEYLYIEV